jgi:hypothetical protein
LSGSADETFQIHVLLCAIKLSDPHYRRFTFVRNARCVRCDGSWRYYPDPTIIGAITTVFSIPFILRTATPAAKRCSLARVAIALLLQSAWPVQHGELAEFFNAVLRALGSTSRKCAHVRVGVRGSARPSGQQIGLRHCGAGWIIAGCPCLVAAREPESLASTHKLRGALTAIPRIGHWRKAVGDAALARLPAHLT